MQDHVVAVGEGTLDLAPRVREFLPQEAEEGLEAFDAVWRRRIVLDVMRPEKLRGGIKVLFVEAGLVEFEHGLLVGFLCRRVSRQNRGSNERQCADETDENESHGSHLCNLFRV